MPPVVGLIGAVVGGLTSAITGITGAIGSFSGLFGFLSTPLGSLILGIGIQLITSLFVRKPQAPAIEAGKVNVRIPEPERWLNAGKTRQGGGVLFAEFDGKGNFWYLIVHSDSAFVPPVSQYYFDDVKLTLNGSNEVTTDEFCLTNDYEPYSGSGTKIPYFKVWSTTYTESNPTPPGIADLLAAFPGQWTTDHKLVGTTYSVVKINALPGNHRYKIYKWRGPVGVGEPALSLVAEWTRVYDPNDGTQTNGVPTTYKHSGNSVLLWAWFRTHRYGRNKPRASINWTRVAEQALICDQNVIGIAGTTKRYRCATSIPESKERHVAEQEILMSCDAQLVFDDDGKCWPRVGYFYTPTLKLTRNRDIIAMDSVEAQNGESETQGVIVRYIDPDANYTAQPAAAWINPLYYIEGQTPQFLKIDALAIQDHNQAMRLAKSVGLRSQSAYKLLPTVGLRGLRARQERIVNLLYDNSFSGDHEIVTPVEVNELGIFCGMGLVPIDANRFNLLEGEEKAKPVYSDASDSAVPNNVSGVALFYRNNRLEATFTSVLLGDRQDVNYVFQYALTPGAPDDQWTDMTVSMSNNIAYSGAVAQNNDYYIRWKAVTTGGKSSGFATPQNIRATVLALTGTPVLTGNVGVAYAGFTIGVTGGVGPYIFSDIYGRLPSGVTLNSSTGVVSGVPTTAATYPNIMLRVSDQVGNYNNIAPFSITIAP